MVCPRVKPNVKLCLRVPLRDGWCRRRDATAECSGTSWLENDSGTTRSRSQPGRNPRTFRSISLSRAGEKPKNRPGAQTAGGSNGIALEVSIAFDAGNPALRC